MRALALVFAVLIAGSCRAEVSCFRTPAQAAVSVGQVDGGGYRLEFVRRDSFSHRSWATVRSCGHPEWPSVVVAAASEDGRALPDARLSDDTTVAKTGHMTVAAVVVKGGARVRVVAEDAMVRMEMSGVAQGSGRVGDRIWVRIVGPADDGNGHMALAVVRGANLLEMGQ